MNHNEQFPNPIPHVESSPERGDQRQSIEDFLKRSGLESVPKIETQFFFNEHSNAREGAMIAERLEDADILVQENIGWDKERLATWQKVSSGELTSQQAIQNEEERGREFFWPEYFKAIFEKVHGTGKEIMLVDIGNDSELYGELLDLYRKGGHFWNPATRSDSYEEACERILDVFELESLLHHERETEILSNMKTALLELLKAKPELGRKEVVWILFSMGSFHTRLYHEMKKEGDHVSREFQSAPYHFNSRTVVSREVHFKGRKASEKYVPKILLLWLLERSNMRFEDITATVLSRFSEEQTRELFEIYQKSESDEEFRKEVLKQVSERIGNAK